MPLNTASFSIIIILFIAFLYYGYKDDYQKNPGEFWRTLIVMPLSFVMSLFGLTCFSNRLKRWAHKTNPKNDQDIC